MVKSALNFKYDMSNIENEFAFYDYLNRLSLLAMSVFKWENLPNNIPERYIEKTLFEYGQILWFEDKTKGLMAVKCSPNDTYNVYEEPTGFMVTSFNYNETYSADDSILLRDNFYSYAPIQTILRYAERLANIERATDINVDAQKTPVLITGQDNQMLTLKNIYKKYNGNEPVIFGDKSLDFNQFKVLKTDAPFVSDKLQALKHQIYNEALTFIGINNANTDKKERLITEEAESNEENVNMSLQTRLLTRQKAVDLVNTKFGSNMKVSIREGIQNNELKEGVEI